MPEATIDFWNKKEAENEKNQEIKRLSRQFSKIEPKRKKITTGLIERAAFMRVALDHLEKDLSENGFWEMFSQGNQEPYQRKRPTAEIYGQMNKNYQSIIKQLTDLLPKADDKPQEKSDGFEGFVNGRDEI